MPLLRKRAISEEMGIALANLPEKYLGVKLISGRVTRASVSNVVDVINRKLNNYKGKMMSFIARAELIKSVLEGIAIHSMAIYKWLAAIVNECSAKIWNFLWSGNCEKRKLITIQWRKVSRPRREGGLGLRQLKDINRAILLKLA